MSSEPEDAQRIAAESLAAREGMSIEQALEALAFQARATLVLDDVEDALGEASGDVWFDWSDGHGRLKIGVATRAEPEITDAVMQVLEAAGLKARADVVKVVWTTAELEAAQRRAEDVLEGLSGSWMTARQVAMNSVRIGVEDDLGPDQVEIVNAAVRAAGVATRVETGPDWRIVPNAASSGTRVPRI